MSRVRLQAQLLDKVIDATDVVAESGDGLHEIGTALVGSGQEVVDVAMQVEEAVELVDVRHRPFGHRVRVHIALLAREHCLANGNVVERSAD